MNIRIRQYPNTSNIFLKFQIGEIKKRQGKWLDGSAMNCMVEYFNLISFGETLEEAVKRCPFDLPFDVPMDIIGA
jgi:hypothetical protein